MLLVNGKIIIAGREFWRVDLVGREGMEMINKPSMLLLVEDWTHEKAQELVTNLNKLGYQE
jgi:hypothetical protein